MGSTSRETDGDRDPFKVINILRARHEFLSFTEKDIVMMLKEAVETRYVPSNQVKTWLVDVDSVKTRLKNMEVLTMEHNTRPFSLKHSAVSTDLIKEADKLLERKPQDVLIKRGLEQSNKVLDENFQDLLIKQGLAQPLEQSLFPNQSPDRGKLLLATEIVGLSVHRTSKQILEYLMDPMIAIIGVYGIGGVGKTTTMMNTNTQIALAEAFESIIWVTVSKIFNLDAVQNEIARQLYKELPTHRNERSRAALLFEMLTQVKFLIIFDDIWESIPLDMVGIPEPNTKNGSKIVLTTRSLEVCHRMSTNKNIQISGLSNEEAWDLFVSKVGDEVLTPDIRPIASKVVGECLSHPLLIITVGQAMQKCRNLAKWENTLRVLRSFQTNIQDPQEVIQEFLSYSFSDLKNVRVERCFLYCAFFPEDYLFEPNELVRYWIAENFITTVGNMTAQTNEGFKILKELKNAGMLQVFKGHLKMHTMHRDLAIGILTNDPDFFCDAGLGLKVLRYGWEWSEVRKISLMRNQIHFLDDIPFSCDNIVTLLLRDNAPLYDISPTFFIQMPCLEFLDLSFTGIVELPTSVSNLVNLRALFLQNCTTLNKIPSLRCLSRLAFLNLRATSIKELPQGTEHLSLLRFLDLSETKNLEKIQEGALSSLFRLEELHLGGSKICYMNTPMAVNSLKEMRHLERLSILTLTTVGFADHLDTIMCLQEKNLSSFTIDIYGSDGDIVNDVEDK